MIILNNLHPELEVMLDENALMPVRAHKPDAGMDILSPVDKDVPAHGILDVTFATKSRFLRSIIVLRARGDNGMIRKKDVIRMLEDRLSSQRRDLDFYDGVHCGLEMALSIIEDIPAIDAFEVVRCKDCKYSGMHIFDPTEGERLACLEVEEDGFVRFASSVNPDGFCIAGERRKG